ncbi:apoptosis-inducing factor homolog B-like [Salvia splendens]|uniref:apoptosis-inducing factor homolog B-like n=1 Tax=Salvia splendens TaxID=180675 RepID=UPI001C27C9A8|nr:apoptosis-inducing factor homolog B-like [Salvia splendens]
MEERQPELGGVWKRVVVVGGGVAGSLIAKTLQFNADVTLIDPKDYFEIPYASLRSKVEPAFAERSVIYHKDYLTNGRLIVGKAISISNSQVLTSEGHQISYDYLVVATGHSGSFPRTRRERLTEFRTEHEEIRSADSILIVGGGHVGVELAAEIAFDFPQKKVTLIHEGSRLMEFIGAKAADKALQWLKSRRVEVMLRQSIDLDNLSEESKTFETSSGERIRADRLFVCTGKPPASDWLKETFLKDSIDRFENVKVDENLRVKGYKNVFAVGDITDVKEIKQGYFAQQQALVAAKNLKVLMEGGQERKMAIYKARPGKIIVSLGRQDAVAQFQYSTWIGLVPGMIKSKDLFVWKTRKKLGLDPRIVDH